ncbi:MAG TPA: MFS transporter [Chloroflexota bacterium]|nr:MFS transporter [Chloroflexota bacterium]
MSGAAVEHQGADGAHGWPRRVAHAVTNMMVETTDRRALVLLLLALGVDYAERTLIGALGPTLEHTFRFGNTTLGLLAAVSGIVSAIATVPFGVLTDRANRTTLLAISLLFFAAAVGVTGAAVSLAMFFVARLALGAVAAVTGPALPSLVGDLVPAGQRARALGLIESGQLVGTGLGFLLAAVVVSFLSFRWCFWLLAIGAAAVALALWRRPEPERTGAVGPVVSQHDGRPARTRVQQLVREAGVEPSQRAVLRQDPDQMSLWDAARYTVRVRTDIILLIARAIGDYFLAAVGTFGVVFATGQYGISQQGADLAILLIGVGALAGFLVIGWVADALLRQRHLTSRLWLGAAGYLLGPFPLAVAFWTHTLYLALPLMMVGAFLVGGGGPALDAVRVDVVVPRLRGRTEAIRQVLRTLAEAGAPLVFGVLAGILSGGSQGLQIAFLVTLPLLLASGLVALIALRTYAPDVAAALVSTDQDGH